MDLYLNGEFVGYSEGAHNTAEFDLSGRLKAGENELVVRRWCTGTYLEDQDMFRNNGIFRDVLLRVSEPTDLWDIDVKTGKTGRTYSLTLKSEVLSDTSVTFTLEGHGVSKKRPSPRGPGPPRLPSLTCWQPSGAPRTRCCTMSILRRRPLA